MRRSFILAAMLLIVGCTSDRSGETRTILLAHMSTENAQLLIEPYLGQSDKVMIRRTESPTAITITAEPSRLEQIEELLKRYDVPAPGVRLRFQVIEADGYTNTDSAIADVESALRGLFRFRGYRLAAEALITTSGNSSAFQRMMAPNNMPLQLDVITHRVTLAGDRKSVELEVTFRAWNDVVLATRVTVPHGQTVVLGSSNTDRTTGTLILVVRPEIE